jgi:hypothetical protein
LIQNAWENKNENIKYNLKPVQIEQTETKIPTSPAAPLKKTLKYKSPDTPIEPDEQKPE